MKAKKVSSQKLMKMVQASIRRFGEFIELERPIILKFSNAKTYYGKYETELIVADTVEFCHIITVSCYHNGEQSIVDSTIAHEMVHAKQIETGNEADHGESFQHWREEIRAYFHLDIEE